MSLKNNILIVSHDAGGADILASWLSNNFDQLQNTYYFLLEGPAISVYRKYFSDFKGITRKEAIELINTFDRIYTSTSWDTDLECSFIKLGAAMQIPVITYFDHWVNFRFRLEKNGLNFPNELPEEVWFGDQEAVNLSLAEGFPLEKLHLVPNCLFSNLINLKESRTEEFILYLCEPISPDQLNFFGYDEFEALELFFAYLEENKLQSFPIVLRNHPSEDEDKYLKLIQKKMEKFTIKKSSCLNYIEDCLKAKLVFGRESMALVHSLYLGKKVYSIIPKKGPSCTLPFNEIVKLKL